MRCLCSGKSKSYIVNTARVSDPPGRGTLTVVNVNGQNGVSTSTTGNVTPGSTVLSSTTNGIDTTHKTLTEVQIHNNENNDVMRYNDTSKTVAKEFTSLPTSKGSTPEGTLKKKAPQPNTKTSQTQVSTSQNAKIVESKSTILSEKENNFRESSEIHRSSPPSGNITPQSTILSENKKASEIQVSVSQNTTTAESQFMTVSDNETSVHKTSEVEVSSSQILTGESTKSTTSMITRSKSESSLLTVPSPTNTLSNRSSVTSAEKLTTPTAHLSLESSENLDLVARSRQPSVGELLTGSARSSGFLEENEATRRPGVEVSVHVGPEVTGEEVLPVFKKNSEDEEKIRKAIEKNEFLSRILSGKRLQDIINAMQLKNVVAKQKLIKQGEKGSEMFVSKEGTYKILVKGKVVGEFNDTRVFGELAILYNAQRLASIHAASTGKVWVLNRHVYQEIVISSNLKEQDENLRFLQNVESLNVVSEVVLRQVSNLLKPEFHVPGSVIIKQGDKGDKFYIIRAGTVTISKSGEGVLGKLGKGQCFGEMALQKEDTRQATVTAEAPGVECLTLTRADFINHFGDVEIPKIEVKKTSFGGTSPPLEHQDIKLEDLKIVKTLGVGGFGRVELVQHKKKKDLIFALKYLKKIDIVYQNQQEHVYNEKIIQMNSRSPFIVRLYRTYKDNKYVYFLMESCLGGDLFSLLHRQKGKRFEEKDAKFLSACVLEALEYLHSKGVVYRDLKPENLLIDKNGYLKLTDFGFAKKMPARGKTFTFAGTPEYVAPEIVLNRGHDKAVDYWAFGAFIFELLTGRTPFRTGDSSHMRTYNKILNGIDNANFPQYMNPKARNLIEKLCRPVPAERLGMQRGAAKDIKAHKWYQGFDWLKFQQCQIPSPFKPKLKDITDTSNFDLFKQDKDYPPDETSGWDIQF